MARKSSPLNNNMKIAVRRNRRRLFACTHATICKRGTPLLRSCRKGAVNQGAMVRLKRYRRFRWCVVIIQLLAVCWTEKVRRVCCWSEVGERPPLPAVI